MGQEIARLLGTLTRANGRVRVILDHATLVSMDIDRALPCLARPSPDVHGDYWVDVEELRKGRLVFVNGPVDQVLTTEEDYQTNVRRLTT